MYIDPYIREYGFIVPENIPLTSDVAYINIHTHPMLYRFSLNSRPIVAKKNTIIVIMTVVVSHLEYLYKF